MANGSDPRFAAAAGASIEQESTVVPPPPPPPRDIPTANILPNRVNLTEENQSLLNSIRSSVALTPQETATCMQSLFNLMTSSEDDGGAAQFREVVSRLDGNGSDLRKMAVLLTSDYGRFLEMARNKNGSNRIRELLGKSNDVDGFFFNAILRRFVPIMTDWDASRVAMQGMLVFSHAKKTAMYDYVLRHAVELACGRYGCAVLSQIISDLYRLGYYVYRDQLLYKIALNALPLSYHANGHHVIQHVLSLHDLPCRHNVSVSLSGHCFGLSFTKFGSHIVQKLLDTEEAGAAVVGELLWGCDGETLVSLARSQFGKFVVGKALRVMQGWNRMDLFWGLVNKLRPFAHLFHGHPGRKIGHFLESLC